MSDLKQIEAAIEVILAVADTIRDVKRVPSGELYARMMGTLNLRTYLLVIDRLKGAKLIKEENYELIWIGPPKV